MRTLFMRSLVLRALGLVVAALILPGISQAATLNYRNVDFTYLLSAELDSDDDDIDGDGFMLRGSLPVYENFFVIAEFETLNFDFDLDVTRFAVGAGGHWPINDRFDVIARVGVVNLQVEFGSFDDDDTGLFIGGRVRGMVTPEIELEGGVEHLQAEVGGYDSDTYLVGEARYHFNTQWSAGVLVNLGGDLNRFGIQARLQF
jgi:hypothetical protein